MIGNSVDETNFPHKILLTNKQGANLRKVFANCLSADIKLSKTQLSKIVQSGGFLGRLLAPLLKTGLLLMKIGLQPLIKNGLMPLGLTAAAAAADGGIHKKILGSRTTALIISNGKMEDIMKILISFENYGILLKELVNQKMKQNNKKVDFLVLLGTLGASLIGNVLAGWGVDRAGDAIIRDSYESLKKQGLLMLLHPLTKYEIQ